MQIRYNFHGVGQGLFCSGITDDFRWIYDCGSLDTGLLKESIKQIGGEVDMLAISHFHEDHVNGIPELIRNGIKIKLVLIPYLSPEERACVCIDLAKAGTSVDTLQLLHSPAQYFQGRDAKIIYVMPTDDGNFNDSIPVNIEELGIENGLPPDDQWRKDDNVYSLEQGRALKCNDFLFIPFYDTSCLRNSTKKLQRNKYFDEFFNFLKKDFSENTAQEYNRLIQQIRTAREKIIKDPEKYSLCLLGTPSDQELKIQRMYHGICNKLCCENRQCKFCSKIGVLYTGDAPLKAKCREKNFMKFYNRYLNNICCFQVMHHGSSYNFHEGIAKKISPCASIFAANPAAKFHHPHKETIIEFFDYHPSLVNQHDFEVKMEC